jgi:hydroxymethylpyrimidine/phosphomethylpyrimidine kinase
MKIYPVVLTIAGSDSGGGAGIQADLKTMSALGAFGTSALTAVTAQNTLGVHALYSIAPPLLAAQIDAVMSDFPVKAVKTGMIGQADAVLVIAALLAKYNPPHLVVDPVMVATSGNILMDNATVARMKKELFPLACLVTPNLNEAAVLSGCPVHTMDDMLIAAKRIALLGCRAVLVKGGHRFDNEMTDVLWMEDTQQSYVFSSKRIETRNLHGTGCSLSAAIATLLALGASLPQAVELAKEYITSAIEAGKDIQTGQGNGAINHFFDPVKLRIITE